MPEVSGKLWNLRRKEVQWQESNRRDLLLLVPPASLLEGQVDASTTCHVVVSQGPVILDEDAFITIVSVSLKACL